MTVKSNTNSSYIIYGPNFNDLPRISPNTNLSKLLTPVQEVYGEVAVTKTAVVADFFGKGYTGSQGFATLVVGYTGSGSTDNFLFSGYTGSGGSGGIPGSIGTLGEDGFVGYAGSAGFGYTGSNSEGGMITTEHNDRTVAYWSGTQTSVLYGADKILVSARYSEPNNINLQIGGSIFGVGYFGTDIAYSDDYSIVIGYETTDANENPWYLYDSVIIGSNVAKYSIDNYGSIDYGVGIGTDCLPVTGEESFYYSYNDIAIGHSVLSNSSLWSQNSIGIGSDILTSSTISGQNIAIGEQLFVTSGVSTENIALGYRALYNANYSSINFAAGNSSLESNIEGDENVAIGAYAAYSTLGQSSVPVTIPVNDYTVDYFSESGQNIAIGNNALYSNQYDGNNIAIGRDSLLNTNNVSEFNAVLSEGSYWSAFEYVRTYPNIAIGNRSLSDNKEGLTNIAIGTYAGTGPSLFDRRSDGGIYIGHKAVSNLTTSTSEIVIGNRSTGKGSSTTYIAGSLGIYNEQNVSTWQTVSDQRIKKNIVDNNIGLDVVKSIQVKSFNYKTNEEIPVDEYGIKLAVNLNTRTTATGVIAQEILPILPQSISVNSNGVLSLNRDPIFWAMLNSIKQLADRADILESKINANLNR